jgi:hypothetical protein
MTEACVRPEHFVTSHTLVAAGKASQHTCRLGTGSSAFVMGAALASVQGAILCTMGTQFKDFP